jgi:hypothetical protein
VFTVKGQIVYESMFGNTMMIAEAIAEGIARHGCVEVIEVGQAGVPAHDLDLLVLGAPTHAFGLSRPATRQNASRQAPLGVISEDVGLREWIATLADAQLRTAIATFDTKVARPGWLPGSAASGAAKRLRRMHLPVLVRPETFYVEGAQGPLVEGELVRARQWGDWIARLVTTGRQPVPRGYTPRALAGNEA